MKILIETSKQKLNFKIYNKNVSNNNLNNTNVIDTKSIIFTEEYIKENIDLVSSFIKVIVIKNNIETAIVDKFEIAETAIEIVKQIDCLKEIKFKQKINLPYHVYECLKTPPYISKIEAYSMAEYMFEELNRKGIHIALESEVFFVSKFMANNDLKTYSDLYYKKSIKIDSKLDKYDLEEINTFLRINNHLKTIKINNYDRDTIMKMVNLLNDFNFKKVKINICEQNGDVIPEIDFLKKIQKKNKKKIKFNIIYSDKYKKENKIKQLNLNILKIISLVIIITISCFFIINRSDEHKAKKTGNEAQEIKEKVTEKEDEKEVETAYNKKYSKIFSELKKINDETIGWLTVNNTNIDYPVVKHNDNDFYLKHDFNKDPNMYGWLFADYRNTISPLDRNTIIYGHDSGTVMFSGLYGVKNSKWYKNKKNQVINFNTESANMDWQIFSIYSIDDTNDYLLTAFSSDEEYTDFINMISNRSIYNFNVSVGTNDKILTLSTCYGDTQKLVVHAKLKS